MVQNRSLVLYNKQPTEPAEPAEPAEPCKFQRISNICGIRETMEKGMASITLSDGVESNSLEIS